MPWKTQVLADYDQKSIADAATIEVVKLPQGIFSSIQLRLSGTGGSGTPAVDALIATTKIKTDKGYIWDMRSVDMQKLARALTGRIPTITNATGAYTETNQSLYFGRYPRDKAYMLDLRNSNVRTIELTFGTLIAATAWATTTVVLTITVDEWIGNPPPEYKGCMAWKEVENKATGTGKAIFDLYQGFKVMGIYINIGTITTIRQCTLSDKKLSIIFAQANFRDILNLHNSQYAPDTVETLDALWRFWDWKDLEDTEVPDLSKLSDPAFSIERGATTSTSRIVQGIVT
jgi:hypothetical protein